MQDLLVTWGILDDLDLIQEGTMLFLVPKEKASIGVSGVVEALDHDNPMGKQHQHSQHQQQQQQQQQQQHQQQPLWQLPQNQSASALLPGAAGGADTWEQPAELLELLPPPLAQPTAAPPPPPPTAAAAPPRPLPSLAAGAAAPLVASNEDDDDEYAGIATFTTADRKKLQLGLELLRRRRQRAKLVGKGGGGGPAGEELIGGPEGQLGPPPAHLVQQLRQNVLRSMKGKPPSVNINRVGDPRQLFPPELVPYRKVRGWCGLGEH